MPEKFRTAEFLLTAMEPSEHDFLWEFDAQTLEYAPEEIRAEDFYLAVVKKSGFALKHVPEKFKTARVCLEAMKNDPSKKELDDNKYEPLLQFVPKNLITAELCQIAAKRKTTNEFEHIPDEHRTDQMYLDAVKTNGYMLRYIPDEFKTAELCKDVAKECKWLLCNALASGYVSKPEFMEAMAWHDPWVLEYIPDEHKTPELCLSAVKYDGWILENVPMKHRTEEICMTASGPEARRSYL